MELPLSLTARLSTQTAQRDRGTDTELDVGTQRTDQRAGFRFLRYFLPRLKPARIDRVRSVRHGWGGAARDASSGSPSPLRSPAACPLRGQRHGHACRQPAITGAEALAHLPQEFPSAERQLPGAQPQLPLLPETHANILIEVQTATSVGPECQPHSSEPPRQLTEMTLGFLTRGGPAACGCDAAFSGAVGGEDGELVACSRQLNR